MNDPATAGRGDMPGHVFRIDGRSVSEAEFVGHAIDPARSVAVEACAGSGKTTLLVRRIVRCLLAGAEPSSILAITFTRAAAQEMQVRVRGLLRRLAFEDEGEALALLSDELCIPARQAAQLLPMARGLYERTLTDRRGLDITTFHRWFWQLARAGSRVDGSDPALDLAERDAELLDEAWLAWLDGLAAAERAPLAERFEHVVRNLGAWTTRLLLDSFVRQRTEWVAALESTCEFDDEADALALAARSQDAVARRWMAALHAQAPGLLDRTDERVLAEAGAILARQPALREEMAFFARLLSRGHATAQRMAAGLAAALEPDPAAGETVGSAGWWAALVAAIATGGRPRAVSWEAKAFGIEVANAGGAAELAPRWEALVARVIAWQGLAQDAVASLPLNRDLVSCAASFACAYRAVKQERGMLDFVDLEALATRLLGDDGFAAYLQLRLDLRYRHLMFDEFQDTSSLQWMVIGDWLRAYAGAGTAPGVFVVGDPKQSIYRFRRAESRVFGAACELLAQAFGASRLTTATTRRNAPQIMAALNRCLHGAMPGYLEQATLAPAGASFARRLPLAPATPGAGAVTAASFDWLRSARAEAESRRHDEGQAIGAAILDARLELARDGRPLPWREVIVLARSRAGFPEYERALRGLGIPVVSDRKGGLLDSLEAQDLVALMSFVRDPEDDLSLAQVLRSPLAGLDAAEIGRLAGARGRASLASALRASSDPRHAAIVARLDGWREQARRLPVHDFLEAALGHADAEAAYACCVEPARREIAVGNLKAMIGLALDHDGGRYPSIASFLYQIGALDRLDDKDAPDEGRPVEHDAVRLMTVHGAKGLEADLVVLADAGGRSRADGARFAVEWPPGEPRPAATWFRLDASRGGFLSRELDQRERALADVEDWNLMYVAATRARRGLIVSAQPGTRPMADSWYARLDAMPESPPGTDEQTTPGDGRVRGPGGAGDAGVVTVPGLHLPSLPVGARRDRLQAAADRALKAGTAMHLALEHLAGGMDAQAVADLLSHAGVPGAVAERALDLARAVRAMPALRSAFEPGRGLDEFELFDGDGRLLRIDRLSRVGDELWILDYKWSVEPELREPYAAQLAGYRRAVTQLAETPLFDGAPPTAVRTVLVDASGGRVQFDVDLA